jgi:hypothetical protein
MTTQMYDQDTFFQLSKLGQAGLALLSLGLAFLIICLTLAAFRKISRLFPSIDLAVRLFVVMGVFWLFLWLSPQIYYTYYQSLFDNLPWQIVISTPPTARDLSRILLLQNTNSLAEHSKAVLGWLLILLALKNTYRHNS